MLLLYVFVWGEILTRIAGHALARTLFKESPEDKAQRIAEEKRLLEEKKREENARLIRQIPIIIIFIAIASGIVYLVWLAYQQP